jgi:hypothetical protein
MTDQLPTLRELVDDLRWHADQFIKTAVHALATGTSDPAFYYLDQGPTEAERQLGQAVTHIRCALDELSRITVDHPVPGHGLPGDAASSSVAAAPAAAGGESYRPVAPASGRDAGDTSVQTGVARMDAHRGRPVGGFRWPGTDEIAESVYRATVRKART